MQSALRKKDIKGPLRGFAVAVKQKNTAYGSQLDRNAVNRYEELVRAALEQGQHLGGGTFRHKADFDIGIDIKTGKPTSSYRLDGAPHGAHIIPIP